MTRVVFDCNVIMSGIGWRTDARRCLMLLARRRLRAFASDFVLEEYQRVAKGMEADGTFPDSPWPALDWFLSVCRRVEPVPLGKQRSRDAKDDPYIAAALAAKAAFIITRDPDLLDMGKPFGVEIITPREALGRVLSALPKP